MVLILLGLVVLSVFVERNLSAFVKENLTVTLILTSETSDGQAAQLRRQIEALPYIQGTAYTSKAEALKQGTKALGADPSEFAGGNPFTAEIELHLQPSYANNDSVQWIAPRLKALKGVQDVDYKQDLMDSVNSMLGKISLVLLVLAALLTTISFALINNTIRLSIYARRFSIHTMKLVGASYGFIRAPFLKKAVGLGLLSAVIALAALGVGLFMLYQNSPEISTVIDGTVIGVTALIVVLFGVLITLFCSWLSVNSFLKMKASDLYKI